VIFEEESNVCVRTAIAFLSPEKREKRRFAGFAGSNLSMRGKRERKYLLKALQKRNEKVFLSKMQPSIDPRETCKPANLQHSYRIEKTPI
jgi:hypothetical protein